MTMEHDHTRVPKPTSVTPDSSDEPVGRHTATEALTGGQGPLASGLIMRKGDGGGAGMSAGAEAAVSAAAGSSGTALPEHVRTKFERSLGADLSSVRIHTSDTSGAAARAVGAKAYAVGQDIHFAPGQFDLGSLDGERLLAHEVAHTVQQQGGSPTRQNKLAVSTSSDHAEVEADNAADAMVTGAAFSMSRAPTVIARKPGDPGEQAAPTPTAAEEDDVDKELAAIQRKATAARTALATKTAGKAVAAKAAIAKADANAMEPPGNAAADAIKEAETIANPASDQLLEYDEDVIQEEGWTTADRAVNALNAEINTQATAILNALEVPGAGAKVATSGGDSLGADVRARIAALRPVLIAATGIKARAVAVGGKQGTDRAAAATAVKKELDALSPGERLYTMQVIRAGGVAPDVIEILDKGAPAAATGGNAAVESDKQGAPVFKVPDASTKAVGPKEGDASIAARDKMLDDKGQLKKGDRQPDPVVNGDGKQSGTKYKVDPGSGEGSLSRDFAVGKNKDGDLGKLSASGTADVRADDGSMKFEGAKFEAGYSLPGANKTLTTSVKGGAGFTQVISPPTFDGVRWIVVYTITKSASAGVGKATASGSVGGDVKLSGSLVKGGSKVFTNDKDAKAFYDAPRFLLDDKMLEHDLIDAKAAADLKEGETFTLGQSSDLGGSVTGGAAGITAGVGISGGGGVEAKLTKKGGQKIQATFREIAQKGGSASVSTTGIGGSAGIGTADAVSVTVEFDLATDAGKKAYTAWAAHPGQAPAAGPGVTIISRGKGSFSSKNVGIGVVNATASNTSTTGDFTEKTADGKHEQTTLVGTQTDAVKGFSPTGPDKQTRVDSLEITTTDGDAANAAYTVKSSVQAQADAKAANAELNKISGDSNGMGTSLDGMKTSGTTGKWAVESSYSKKQIDDFAAKVASGKVQLSHHANQADPEGEQLKAVLAKKSSTEAEKQKAMTAWFAARGPSATSDLRDAVGEPAAQSVVLEGDKYITGAAGQGVFVGKLTALQARLADPKLAGDAIKTLLTDVQALYVEQTEARDHIANPTHYPELPPLMRQKLVRQVDANYAQIYPLRQRVLARAHEAKLGDPAAEAAVEEHQKELYKERGRMATARGSAVDRRMKHAGAGSAGLDNPRSTLSAEKPAYDTADRAWTDAIKQMEGADGERQAMLKEHNLDDASRASCRKHTDTAQAGYKAAADSFEKVRTTLDAIYQRAKPQALKDKEDKDDKRSPEEKKLHPRGLDPKTKVGPFMGYETQFYGTREF